MTKQLKRPRDPNQLAHLIAGIATGEIDDARPNDGKNKAAQELGKLGGAKRASNLTPEKRSEIAKKAAGLRWAAKTD